MESYLPTLRQSILTPPSPSHSSIDDVVSKDAQQLKQEYNRRGIRYAVIKLTVFIAYCIVACLFYCNYEGWTIKGALFFTVITMSSVGYGYRHPTDDNSRLFTMFFLIFGIYFIYVGLTAIISERVRTAAKMFEQNNSIELMGMQISNYKRMMFWNVVGIVIMILIGGCIGMALEGWSFIGGLYFALQTATTVGYGDMAITNENTYVFAGIFIVFSTVLFAVAVNNFTMLKAQEKQMLKLKQMQIKRKDLRFLEELDTGAGITKEQFVLALLVHLGTVDADTDVKPWLQAFEELDPNGDGKLHRSTLQQFSIRESEIADIKLMYPSLRPSELPSSNIALRSLFSQNRVPSTVGGGVDLTVRASTISPFRSTAGSQSNAYSNSHSISSNETA